MFNANPFFNQEDNPWERSFLDPRGIPPQAQTIPQAMVNQGPVVPSGAAPTPQQVPQQQGGDPSRLGRFLGSPGMAMADQAMNNMYAMRRGQAPSGSAVQVYQRAVAQRAAQTQRDRVEERAAAQESRAAGRGEREANPEWKYEHLRDNGLLPDKMTYQEFLVSEFNRSGTGASAKAFAPQVGEINGKKVMLMPTWDPDTQSMTLQQHDLPEGYIEDSGIQEIKTGQEILLYRKKDGKFLGLKPVEVGPEQTPEHLSDVALAKGEAAATVDANKIDLTNERARKTYNIAIAEFRTAMGDTSKGPFVGLLPAITSGQQTAEAAAAVMAPILKNIFREAGEGTFTEGDQKILMDMLPKRTDKPEVVKFKFMMIDKIVQTKLAPVARPDVKGAKEQSEDGSVRAK